MGQFLDSSKFKTGLLGNRNGLSEIGNSTIFFSNHTTLDGVTAITPTSTGGICVPLSIASVPTGNFNAVRSGPMCVKYEYTGRLDNSSGLVSMGLGYTQVTDAGTFGGAPLTQENGLVY